MTNDTPPDGAPPPASADRPTATRREPRHSKRVVLQADVDADGRRNLSVELEGDDVVIRGHDLGPVVTRAWGAGTSEYEWTWRIPAASFPAMLAALGATRATTRSSSSAAGPRQTPAATRASSSSPTTCRSSSGTG
jgi:hypothetical protein